MSDRSVPAASRNELPGKGDEIAQRLRWHALVLMLCCFIVGMSLILTIDEGSARVTTYWQWPLPQLCALQRWAGLSCPGCGLTRGFLCLMRGQFARAWSYNPAAYLLLMLVVWQIPYQAWQIVRLRRDRRSSTIGRSAQWPWALLVMLLIGQWLFRTMRG